MASEKDMCFKAPNKGLHPDFISTPLLSTNSQIHETIWKP